MEQLNLFPEDTNPKPRRQSARHVKEWKVVTLRESPAPEKLICVNSPGAVLTYWERHVTTSPGFNPDVENVVVLVANTKLRVKGHYLVGCGSLDEAVAKPREVFRLAVMAAAYAIILVHNHPSGEVDPSDADHRTTRRMREAGSILGISLLDHVIVGHQRYFSFKQSGLL